MKIYKNHSLSDINAFGFKLQAKYYCTISHEKDLRELFDFVKMNRCKCIFLGEGSGVLFSENYTGIVCKVSLKGIKISKIDKSKTTIEIGAGENWDNLVRHCIKQGFYGIENMGAIPGTVGAACVQNIAAYGQALQDVFVKLEGFDVKTGKKRTFSKRQCEFGYRESVFKKELQDSFLITKVWIELDNNYIPDISYFSKNSSLSDLLKSSKSNSVTALDVYKAIVKIRNNKFPDWKKRGNSGSYFKNPVITREQLVDIQSVVPEVQYYPVDKLTYIKPGDKKLKNSKHVKVAAGWLFEEIGWRGKRIGKVGTSPNQSLVVVNYNGAMPDEVLSFTRKMAKDFEKHFNIKLEPEVRIV